MMECRLHREGGRAHFMTRRFDRTPKGEKLHAQSLCAMLHFDFNRPDAYSYEQSLGVVRRLGMPASDMEQQYRRAVFNVLGRNHDDHVKNIAYLMNKRGEWRLAPAFDVAYSYNPTGAWTSRHQMSVNGKRDDFALDDLVALARAADIKRRRALAIVEEIDGALERWPAFAAEAGIEDETVRKIAAAQRRLAALSRP
jgi:serine/threonine-protein kinase HipA